VSSEYYIAESGNGCLWQRSPRSRKKKEYPIGQTQFKRELAQFGPGQLLNSGCDVGGDIPRADLHVCLQSWVSFSNSVRDASVSLLQLAPTIFRYIFFLQDSTIWEQLIATLWAVCRAQYELTSP
jgi:hypothetical protein